MAGTGIRGQFEEKFKALIKDIEDEVGEFSLIYAPTSSLISLSRPGWEYNMLHR